MKARKNGWTPDEIDILRHTYAIDGAEKAAICCGHGIHATRTKANELGLKRDKHARYSNIVRNKERTIARTIPQALRKWSIPEIKWLYPEKSMAQIARELGR